MSTLYDAFFWGAQYMLCRVERVKNRILHNNLEIALLLPKTLLNIQRLIKRYFKFQEF